jgi:hypothetical protein
VNANGHRRDCFNVYNVMTRNTSTGVLDPTQCRAHIDRAQELREELVAALKVWVDSGGVEAQSRRSLQFVCYIGYVKVNTAPPINLALRAGEVLNHLRQALAFQIYLAGGGTLDGDDADKVAFPIVTDPSASDRVVARKVRAHGLPPSPN